MSSLEVSALSSVGFCSMDRGAPVVESGRRTLLEERNCFPGVERLFASNRLSECRVKLLGDRHNDPALLAKRIHAIELASRESKCPLTKRVFLVEGVEAFTDATGTSSIGQFLGAGFRAGENCDCILGCDSAELIEQQLRMLEQRVSAAVELQKLEGESNELRLHAAIYEGLRSADREDFELAKNLADGMILSYSEDKLLQRRAEIEARIDSLRRILTTLNSDFARLSIQRTDVMAATAVKIATLMPGCDVYVAAGRNHIIDERFHSRLLEGGLDFAAVQFVSDSDDATIEDVCDFYGFDLPADEPYPALTHDAVALPQQDVR